MKNSVSLFIAFLFSLFFFSCGNNFYIPSQGNLLILQEKKDFKSSIGINSAQLAYSPINKLGLKADYSYVNLNINSNNRRLSQGTLGVGTYFSKSLNPVLSQKKKIPKFSQQSSIGFDAHLNVSLGALTTNGENFDFSGPVIWKFNSNIVKPHLSTNFYWQTRSFAVHFGVRAGALFFYDGVVFGEISPFDLETAQDLLSDSPFPIVEYDLKVSSGNDLVKNFIAISTANQFGPLQENSTSVTFGLKFNIASIHRVFQEKKIRKEAK